MYVPVLVKVLVDGPDEAKKLIDIFYTKTDSFGSSVMNLSAWCTFGLQYYTSYATQIIRELHLHIRLVRNSAKIFSCSILSRPFRPLPPVFRPPCLRVLPAVKQRVHELRAVCLSVYRICPRDLPKSGRILTALKWVRLPTRNC